ncbi:uncharacterized protein L969DRAFT_94243 [Mixia osmundae IAM 14324]|uniref:Vacuolar protein sorting-associated protein 74 n=1 Tax=Mixia osmundae (strain CBS 9802 / IAM 14324 / JCM 22182 / KY 12970) TaxID=764103 RepID=G7E8A1_MIXOS|nr:uncharacterized protein L969DRAFT_94243 [Mixia osmundae IAM 14324]KEI39164.1 hypothetical protein L969DRAFT_94243 [Mixia osmundae IAM 14324]GAA99061.1 hypothetical protein E5Q_05750 [Mixia osmundae IAM 14324]
MEAKRVHSQRLATRRALSLSGTGPGSPWPCPSSVARQAGLTVHLATFVSLRPTWANTQLSVPLNNPITPAYSALRAPLTDSPRKTAQLDVTREMADSASGLSRRRGVHNPSSSGAAAASGLNGNGASSPGGTGTPPRSATARANEMATGSVMTASAPVAPGQGASGSRSQANGTTQTSTVVPVRGNHKIAYDPRDLEDSSEQKTLPRLTLMEEVLLLGLKDKQGYLSFWNDNISYTLRGCIVIELALRHKIAVVRDPNRRRFPLPDRYIEVVDEKLTGEVLLDEALKMMKVSEKMSIGTWIDLMSGETWNVMKIGYQLKQVRERLAKGLVDKGVLRTEKRNFLLFDMATHPVSDPTFKDDVLRRTLSLLTPRTAAVPISELYSETVRYRTIRAVCMVCAAFAANVLDNALAQLSFDARESAFARAEELLADFSQWPFGRAYSASPVGVGTGSSDNASNANLAEISRLARQEMAEGKELHLEVVAGVITVLSRMDSLL